MPSTREEEPRRRKKDYDRDTASRTSRDKDRHRSSTKKTSHRRHSSTSRDGSPERSPSRLERPSTSDLHSRPSGTDLHSRSSKRVTMLVPEMERRSSTGTRASSYPTFSKEHSREAVRSRDGTTPSKVSTEEHTTSSAARPRERTRSQSPDAAAAAAAAPAPTRTPPSPPLTEEDLEAKRADNKHSTKQATERLKAESRRTHRSSESLRSNSVRGAKSSPEDSETSDMSHTSDRHTRPRRERERAHSTSTAKLRDEEEAALKERKRSSREGEKPRRPRTAEESERRQNRRKEEERAAKAAAAGASTSKKSSPRHAHDSKPSINSEKLSDRRPPALSTTDTYSPSSLPEPHTPNDQTFSPDVPLSKTQLPPRVVPEWDMGPQHSTPPRAPNMQHTPQRPAAYHVPQSSHQGSPMAPPHPPHSVPPPATPFTAPPGTPFTSNGDPPPPPPLLVPDVNPRVDYLMRNGGLARPIPRTFLPRNNPQPVQEWVAPNSPMMAPPQMDIFPIFAPMRGRLEALMDVISKNGSVAVATGYHSVARRLLDRLDRIFCRSISEKCCCVMCLSRDPTPMTAEEERGYNWGEILEFVCGRRDLPPWPPFNPPSQTEGLGIVGPKPMQVMDEDLPPEYHAWQGSINAKTQAAVMGWLAQSTDAPTSVPTEVDDETLEFAILTRLDPDSRPMFLALKRGQDRLPHPNDPEPAQFPANDVLAKVSLALSRLYRLGTAPRDAEACLFLLNNPGMHNVLSTLAAITESEWEMLTSGRFDGFLSSGSEIPPLSSTGNYDSGINMSRGTTPFSRNTTPFSRNGTPFMSGWAGVATGESCMSRGTTPVPTMGAAAPVSVDEETEIQVLSEYEREIYRGMDLLENEFEALHNEAERVRVRLRERAQGLLIALQARRGSSGHIDPTTGMVRGGTPMTNGRGGVWSPEPPEGVYLDDGRSEIGPDDSASMIGPRRRREAKTARRTPAPVVEEDEGQAGGHKRFGSLSRRR